MSMQMCVYNGYGNLWAFWKLFGEYIAFGIRYGVIQKTLVMTCKGAKVAVEHGKVKFGKRNDGVKVSRK